MSVQQLRVASGFGQNGQAASLPSMKHLQPPAVARQASHPYLQNWGKMISSKLLNWSVVTA